MIKEYRIGLIFIIIGILAVLFLIYSSGGAIVPDIDIIPFELEE